MKMISWNVNGLRAVMGKNFMEAFAALDADIFCLQETKLQEGQIEMDLPGYHQYWNYAEKKGYSGFSEKNGQTSSCLYGSGPSRDVARPRPGGSRCPSGWGSGRTLLTMRAG